MQHIVFYLNIFFCVAAVLVHYVFEMISLLATKHTHWRHWSKNWSGK